MEAEQIQNLFAGNIRRLLAEAELDYDKLYEIRLRTTWATGSTTPA